MMDRSLGFIGTHRTQPTKQARKTKRAPRRKPKQVKLTKAIPKSKSKSKTPPEQSALLIGIEYVAYAKRNKTERLPGCHRDLGIVHGYLKRRFHVKDITVLSDRRGGRSPTKRAIQKAFSKMVTKAKRGVKHIFIYYSGHGTQVRDKGRDEKDKQDEALVPSDYLTAGMITDDWLYAHFVCKLPQSCTCTIITDCCNSGTVLDLRYRYVPEKKEWVVTNKARRPAKANVITFSGCADPQTSASAYNLSGKKTWRGAMTWALEAVWGKKGGIHTTAENALVSVRHLLKKNGFSQKPQLCSTHNPRVKPAVKNTPLP